ncbi:hypothetical protein [Nocardioides sp.]|uniref:hypothetical protein n=1 Tax=Nocardioides sp. TaxID=35761 RepID=UPI003D0EBF43
MALILSGCSTADSHGRPGETLADGNQGNVAVVDPQGDRKAADASQLAILDSGENISFADYQGAVRRSVACMRDAGIDVVGDDRVDRSRGFPMIVYGFSDSSEGRTDDETLAVADACVAKFSLLVEGEYQTQPTSLEAIEAEFAKRKPVIVDCLRKSGTDIAESASRSEIELKVREILSSQGTDCFAEAGFVN